MHELAICQSLLAQAEAVARQKNADRVTRITLQIGPLSGVIPSLLERTFMIARLGTMAEEADLATEQIPPQIQCRGCGKESVVPMNKLTCPSCGDFHIDLIRGDELILKSMELETEEKQSGMPTPTDLSTEET